MKILKLFIYIICIFSFAIGIIRIVDPSRFHQVIGDWGRKYGYYEFAVEQYTKAIHLNANNAGAFNSRGVASYYSGQFERALGDYNRAIQLDQHYALAIKNRALVFLALGKGMEAKKDYALSCTLGRCEDFSRLCTELKQRCEYGDCTIINEAVKVGLCVK